MAIEGMEKCEVMNLCGKVSISEVNKEARVRLSGEDVGLENCK